VLVVDGLGELMTFYAAGDIAFVGGSLIPVGGHNLLEPAALGRPILTGPNNFNAPDIARALFAAGAALEVGDGEQLAAALTALFDDVARRDGLACIRIRVRQQRSAAAAAGPPRAALARQQPALASRRSESIG
jgi:3-deoxy-D-manno-octulosonic-acid transferase